MNITIDGAAASVITAFIVGIITILTTIIANRYSFRQQQSQWDREERKAEREEQQAIKDRELTTKREFINKLQEIYGNSIASLTTLLVYTDAAMRLRPDYSTNLAETQKWLSSVVTFHYDKASKEYELFLNLYLNAQDSYQHTGNIKKLREMMIEFASKDPRLHS